MSFGVACALTEENLAAGHKKDILAVLQIR